MIRAIKYIKNNNLMILNKMSVAYVNIIESENYVIDNITRTSAPIRIINELLRYCWSDIIEDFRFSDNGPKVLLKCGISTVQIGMNATYYYHLSSCNIGYLVFLKCKTS